MASKPNMNKYCKLCGNEIKTGDRDCQSGGPMPDGCPFNQVGFLDALKELEKEE